MHTICLVEDEKNISNLVKTYLEKEGYKVITSYSGNDALKYINEIIRDRKIDKNFQRKVSDRTTDRSMRGGKRLSVPGDFGMRRGRKELVISRIFKPV